MSHAGSSSNPPSAELPAATARVSAQRYAIAFGAFVIAAALTTLLWDALFVQVPFAAFFAAVMLTVATGLDCLRAAFRLRRQCLSGR